MDTISRRCSGENCKIKPKKRRKGATEDKKESQDNNKKYNIKEGRRNRILNDLQNQ